jgi:hypothetical protein
VATQQQHDPRVDSLIIPHWVVEVLEQADTRSDLEPAFTQHGKTVECIDGIWVQVDQFTPEEVHNRNEKLARRKTKPSNEMRFKADNSGVVYR